MQWTSYRSIGLMLLLAVASVSCDKDNPGDGLGRQGLLEMKVNGAQWKANNAYVVTAHGDIEDGYVIAISGFRNDMTGNYNPDLEEGESIILWFALPPAKFNNPKGTYDVVAMDVDSDGQTMVYSYFYKNLGLTNQRIFSVSEAADSFGKITITDFEIGQQSIFGQIIGGQGYTRLKGSFQMTLDEFNVNDSYSGENLVMTEGRFDVGNQLDF